MKISNGGAGRKREKAAQKFADRLTGLQLKWARFMGRTFGSLSSRTQKILIACFFAAAVCWNLRLMSGSPAQHAIFNMLENRHDGVNLRPVKKQASTDTGIIRRTKDFLYWFDSLDNTVRGRFKRDSIQRSRPGLIDSARQLINQEKSNF